MNGGVPAAELCNGPACSGCVNQTMVSLLSVLSSAAKADTLASSPACLASRSTPARPCGNDFGLNWVPSTAARAAW